VLKAKPKVGRNVTVPVMQESRTAEGDQCHGRTRGFVFFLCANARLVSVRNIESVTGDASSVKDFPKEVVPSTRGMMPMRVRARTSQREAVSLSLIRGRYE
jgi:hypothetical protein